MSVRYRHVRVSGFIQQSDTVLSWGRETSLREIWTGSNALYAIGRSKLTRNPMDDVSVYINLRRKNIDQLKKRIDCILHAAR